MNSEELKQKIIDIIGFNMELERAELKANEIIELINKEKKTEYNIGIDDAIKNANVIYSEFNGKIIYAEINKEFILKLKK